MAKEKIGVLGGTFDPIHRGHIQMALGAIKHAGLDRVLVIPSGDPPYKACCADKESRWQMTVVACSDFDKLVPCRVELDREGPSYTVDTLQWIKKENPKAEIYFIIGADQMMILDRWQHATEIFDLCSFLVCPRVTGVSPADFKKQLDSLAKAGVHCEMVSMKTVTVSSGEIREAISLGKPTPNLHISNREYCLCKGLYGVKSRLPESVDWLDLLFEDLTPHRFSHTLAVAHTARRLARLHDLDKSKAEMAGLLHDCAKCLPLKSMQEIAQTHSLTNEQAVLESGSLLHSIAGAWVARNKYHMADPEVLQAITNHSTGRAGMSQLDMCVFLADSIEPTRQSYPDLDKIRILADLSLERAMLLSLDRTVTYVTGRGKYLYPSTLAARDWLRTLPGIRSSVKDDNNKSK